MSADSAPSYRCPASALVVRLADGSARPIVIVAELPEAEKGRISHRGRAVASATPRLVELLGD